MAKIADNYGRILYELRIPKEDIEEMKTAFCAVNNLAAILDQPVLKKEKKYRLIEQIFPESLHNFVKVLSDHRRCREYQKIFDSYQRLIYQEQEILQATLFCVHEPDEQQSRQMEQFLLERYQAKGVKFQMIHKKDLIGGFVLQVGDREYDWSLKGQLTRLNQRLIRR